MPANLPPQYFEAERKLKTAKNIPDKIGILEEMLSIVPKHKGTEKLQALLKTKISKLKDQLQKKQATARHGPVFYIEKLGAGQVILIGPPNAGKSQILNSLTNAPAEVADYPFTTQKPVPGMMPYKNIQIQLIDTPPITEEYLEPWLPEIIKVADAVLLVVDLNDDNCLDQIEVIFKRLEDKKITLVEPKMVIESEKKPFLKRALIIGNKNDLSGATENLEFLKEFYAQKFPVISISAKEKVNLDNLKDRIYNILDIIRVYSKIPGKKPDLNEPFIFKKGATVMDMAERIHKDFAYKLKYARIWGSNKYDGQKVTKDYILQEEDIIELHI
ncbi:MAG: GTPase [Candidatus Aminicenantia bacterium]